MRDYYNERRQPKPKKKIGFWGYCAIAASAGAAVKITKAILKSREKEAKYRGKDRDIDDEDIDQEDDLSFEVYRGTLKQVLRARKSVIELFDLYGCCTLAELRDIMNQEFEDNDINRVFNKDCKFRIRFEDGRYVLISQPPVDVTPIYAEDVETVETKGEDDEEN